MSDKEERRDPRGPYLQMALFCDRVLQEKDGVLSVIRVIDRINVNVSDPAAPEQMPPIPISTNLVVGMKSGGGQGKANVKSRRGGSERWSAGGFPGDPGAGAI